MEQRPRPVHLRLAWRLAQALHRFDFACVLPLIGRLPIGLGHRLALWRGRLNAAIGRDWRSMALGFRHVRAQSALGYRQLPLPAGETEIGHWVRQRFVVEARDEYEARLAAAHRLHELQCDVVPSGALRQLAQRDRGLVLLTPHYESFFLGIAFLARAGVRVNAMSSAVTHDPRVDAAVRRHFTAKYRGLDFHLNGGRTVDLETGTRQFYRMLQHKEILVILADAPVAPGGAEMTVDFLGGPRRLSGGPLRMAQATGSDVGGFVCRHVAGQRYRLELGPIGPAADPGTPDAVYRFLSQAILANPGGWWASDLLPAMPLVPATPQPTAAPAAAMASAPAAAVHDLRPGHDTLVLMDSPLAGTGELTQGVRRLRSRLRPASGAGWHEREAADAPPAAILAGCTAPFLLVLVRPALIATGTLPVRLHEALASGRAKCAIAADQRGAGGEWAIGYTSDGDFERYVERRRRLPATAPWPGETPCAYLVEVAAAREALGRIPGIGWADLPAALGQGTVLAPRAFVHAYDDYQQGERAEMLDLLPGSVRRLMDVGGGEGRFARAFLRQRRGEAWVVEPSEAAARAEPHEGLHVFRGRLEDLDTAAAGEFDAISFLDVLEHMEDPLAALVTARRFLRPGGLLLASVPNVGHWSIVRDLAQGRFEYGPVGILCATHLRFFTEQSLARLLGDAGFEIRHRRRAGPPMPEDFERFLAATGEFGWDRDSLQTESLHVLAALR